MKLHGRYDDPHLDEAWRKVCHESRTWFPIEIPYLSSVALRQRQAATQASSGSTIMNLILYLPRACSGKTSWLRMPHAAPKREYRQGPRVRVWKGTTHR